MADKAHTLLGEPLIGHTSTVTSVAFSPDGHTLASGSADETIRLWNVTNRVHPLLLGPLLTSRTGVLFSVSFSPDGRILANGSEDGTVQLWRV
jgi:WD40 repeat protein